MIEIKNTKKCVDVIDDEKLNYVKHIILNEDYTILPNIYDIETGIYITLSEDNEQVFIVGMDDKEGMRYYSLGDYINCSHNKEIKIIFFNTTNNPIIIKKGTCIAEIFYTYNYFNGYNIYNQDGLNIQAIDKNIIKNIETEIDSENNKFLKLKLNE